MAEYHVPVMLQECIHGLNIKPDGIYVDVTFGGGGHSKEILKHLSGAGRLFGFDQDEDARLNAEEIDNRTSELLDDIVRMTSIKINSNTC